jgi:hypothetical protein
MKFKELLLREDMFLRILGTVLPWFWTLVLWYIGRWFSCILDPAFDVFGRWLQLFVLGPYFRPRRNGALHL